AGVLRAVVSTTAPPPVADALGAARRRPATGRLSGAPLTRRGFVGLARRIGRVFRKSRVHVVPGLRALDKDIRLGTERARIVERADPDGDEVGPGGDAQEQHRAAIRAERTGDLVAAVRRPEVELGLALGDPEARRRHPPAGGKRTAALALAVAAVAEEREAGLARRFIANRTAQAAARHRRHEAQPSDRL